MCNKISIDTIHVTRRGYNGIHIFMTIVNTFFYLGKTEMLKIRYGILNKDISTEVH